ncbi:thioredoxin domain-containing protein [Patescibacteria group bacterium]|nr:thioredoxin domain-containing protein [Patescibacteria group bacterium]
MENNSKNSLSSAIIVASILISLSVFYLGYTLQKNPINLQNQLDNNSNVQGAKDAPIAAPSQQAPQVPAIQTVSVDDDAFIGKENAPVTIIEFSDFECPFCKRFIDDAYKSIKSTYVDTGKVKLYFRDLPLSFHEPMATKMALSANCAREQGQDAGYFKMHDEIFANTATNGKGFDDTKLYAIVTKLGYNLDTFKTCMSDKSKEDEIKKDSADAASIGASGTPTFFIGKSTKDGKIQGEMVVGAQPFSAFDLVIKKYL